MLIDIPAHLRHYFNGTAQAPASTVALRLAEWGGFTIDRDNDDACLALARMIALAGARRELSAYVEHAELAVERWRPAQLVEVARGLGFGGQVVTAAIVDVEDAVHEAVVAALAQMVQQVQVR
jgi:hypothetical protein